MKYLPFANSDTKYSLVLCFCYTTKSDKEIEKDILLIKLFRIRYNFDTTDHFKDSA